MQNKVIHILIIFFAVIAFVFNKGIATAITNFQNNKLKMDYKIIHIRIGVILIAIGWICISLLNKFR